MNRLEKVLYTAKTHTTGGRAGVSRSSDGRLEVRPSRPGSPGTGTNPEQLFAAGWSACFELAMEFAARKMKIALPADHAVDAEIGRACTRQRQPQAHHRLRAHAVQPSALRWLDDRAHPRRRAPDRVGDGGTVRTDP